MSDTVPDLLAFLDASPTPWHAVAEAERRLTAAGFTRVFETDATWDLSAGTRAYLVRGGGSLMAWRIGAKTPAEGGFRLLGAHTDSPNFRVKPNPDVVRHGAALLGLEVYGGVLLGSWTDRDLGLAGRVVVRTDGGKGPLTSETRLLRVDRPLARIPQLAIHLNRGVNDDGLKLNMQDHLPALWALAGGGEDPDESAKTGRLRRFLGRTMDVDPESVLGWDLCLVDLQGAAISGESEEFLHSARLDDLACCHAGLAALIGTAGDETDATTVLGLFDHEEVGSNSHRGAASSLTRDVLTRLSGGDAVSMIRAAQRSVQVSMDMAHAVHPNYGSLHDPEHKPVLGGGPVVKIHCNTRYATDGETAALMRGLAQQEGLPLQEFVIRTDLPCGSTIGPIVATELGMRTVDIGNPMLSMHSCREMASARDPEALVGLVTAFLRWPGGGAGLP